VGPGGGMRTDREGEFVAVDGGKLGANPRRGHGLTERLLHARGRRETWFMGSEAVKSAVEELVPAARFEQHPRLSKLAFAGARKLHGEFPKSGKEADLARSHPRTRVIGGHHGPLRSDDAILEAHRTHGDGCANLAIATEGDALRWDQAAQLFTPV